MPYGEMEFDEDEEEYSHYKCELCGHKFGHDKDCPLNNQEFDYLNSEYNF